MVRSFDLAPGPAKGQCPANDYRWLCAKTPPSMYDTPLLVEVKQILGLQVSFFPFFLTTWHKNRIPPLFGVSGQPEVLLTAINFLIITP
jgi:hypothetical protein